MQLFYGTWFLFFPKSGPEPGLVAASDSLFTVPESLGGHWGARASLSKRGKRGLARAGLGQEGWQPCPGDSPRGSGVPLGQCLHCWLFQDQKSRCCNGCGDTSSDEEPCRHRLPGEAGGLLGSLLGTEASDVLLSSVRPRPTGHFLSAKSRTVSGTPRPGKPEVPPQARRFPRFISATELCRCPGIMRNKNVCRLSVL